MALLERFPRERDSTSSDDVAGHGAEFVEHKFRSVRDIFSDLDSPSGVGVRGGLVGFFRSGRGGIQVGLSVMVRREVKKYLVKVGASEWYARPNEEVLTRYLRAYRAAS